MWNWIKKFLLINQEKTREQILNELGYVVINRVIYYGGKTIGQVFTEDKKTGEITGRN